MEPDGQKKGGEWVFILALLALLLCVVAGVGFYYVLTLFGPTRPPTVRVVPAGPNTSSGAVPSQPSFVTTVLDFHRSADGRGAIRLEVALGPDAHDWDHLEMRKASVWARGTKETVPARCISQLPQSPPAAPFTVELETDPIPASMAEPWIKIELKGGKRGFASGNSFGSNLNVRLHSVERKDEPEVPSASAR
jgi:hypothetical protein